MENTLVSARVPKARKEAAARLLASEGTTMSDLINAAIDQLLNTGELPGAGTAAMQERQAGFAAFVSRSTLDISWPANTPDDYRELERDWRRRDYESLA